MKKNVTKQEQKEQEQDEIDSYDNYEKYNNIINTMYDDTENKQNIKNTNNTEIKKKECHNGQWCEDCKTDNIIEDASHGIFVCKNCGQVVSNLLDIHLEWTQFGDGDKKDNE